MNKKILVPLFLSSVVFSSVLTSCGSKDEKLTYEGRELTKAKVGVEYNENVSLNKDGVTYEIDYDSDLPTGLELSSEGIIFGTPEIDGTFEFSIVAVKGKTFAIGQFSMTVIGGDISFTGSTLPNGKENEPYLRTIATATGSDSIKYTLKEGSTLPEGLDLAEDGEISGTPTTKVENHQFIVVAKAQGCSDKEATFTITIEEGKEIIDNLDHIEFEGKTLDVGEVGDEYYQNLATAYGVKGITYKIKYVGGIGLPKGLTFKNGIISGKPTDSTYGKLKFQVVASATGFTSVTKDFYLEIKDKYVATNDFEAEYIYVDNLVGAGYSGSNSGKNMIQEFKNASNTHVVGYLNTEITLTFNITSSVATSADLSMFLGTENGAMTLNQTTFRVVVNDANIAYDPISINEDGEKQEIKFHEHMVNPKINLLAGDNVLQFKVLKVADGEGTSSAKGPLFDKIKITGNTGEVGWRPKVANLN